MHYFEPIGDQSMTYQAPEAIDEARPRVKIWSISARIDAGSMEALREIEAHYQHLPSGVRSHVIRSAILTLHRALGLADPDRR